MKKLLLAFYLLALVPACVRAEGPKGLFGIGVRGGDFSARYFASDSLGLEAVTALRFIKNDSSSDSSMSYFGGGAFYNRSVAENVYFQAGALLCHSSGQENGRAFGQWYAAPVFIGAEAVISRRFGIDFRFHPVEVALHNSGGKNRTTTWALFGSLGAHLYF